MKENEVKINRSVVVVVVVVEFDKVRNGDGC
jgi:hypothetical protein